MTGHTQFLGWYYHKNGKQIGPLTSEELSQLITSGQLKTSDEVLKAWKHGGQLRFYRSRAGVVLGRWEEI